MTYDRLKVRGKEMGHMLDTGGLMNQQYVEGPEDRLSNDELWEMNRQKSFIVCAWCKKKIREVRPFMQHPSHGICEECFDKVMEEMYISHQEEEK
jgi:hypothetical protein